MFGKSEKQTYVISSPMEGTLTRNGTPLANTTIVRSLSWSGRDGRLEQKFATDDQGRFSLPIHEERLSLGRFTQFACSTYLGVEVEGERFDVWYNTKFEGHMYAENEGRQLPALICDLGNEEMVVRVGLSRITTVCRWAGMPPEADF